jgi:hypothetical protein
MVSASALAEWEVPREPETPWSSLPQSLFAKLKVETARGDRANVAHVRELLRAGATGKGNIFVVFGEPDFDIRHVDDGRLRVYVKGVDVFDPTTGEVRSDGADGIACWFNCWDDAVAE